jgi:murein DD-endopeptidase MepM/ murein hydrolase activator NlpD
MGIGYGTMLEVLESAADVYDFTRVRVGKTLHATIAQGTLNALAYDMDTESQVLVERTGSTYTAKEIPIAYAATRSTANATIDSSLFVAGAQAGLQDRTILAIAEVFAWNIDFATQIQQGDAFSVLYESRTRDGQEAPDGPILAATFTTGGETFTAVRFEAPDGTTHYYDEEGNSLVRQFLKAPLKYSRITSGYTNSRFHPTLQKNMSHLAIDYAAPLGTPIYAVGDGVVKSAGWGGGYGNLIKLKHNSTYSTNYAHLTRFAKGITAGARVTQGQVIGYVGSTGFSTGPHLHYEIEKNGVKVNPLGLELPAGEPIKSEWKAEFDAQKQALLAELQ